MQRDALLDRARTRGVNPLVYWIVRAVLQPFFHVYWRLSRLGREHVPASGPVIFAANHRSFLDPFVIAVMARRPIYFVAKKELFEDRRLRGWFLNSLGAFPIDRGASDEDAMGTARTILERGDAVLIFPEGTRNRPGGLGPAKRGVGRLALETGAPVVPIAVRGTDRIREGWRIRPHKISIRAGRPLTFPHVEDPSPQLAQAVTDRIWPCVQLQWEWLGGTPALRRAVVVGTGQRSAAFATVLERAGLEVQTGPDLDVERADLVVLAVDAAGLPAALAAHGDRVRPDAGVLTLAHGLVAPHGELPVAHVAARLPQARVAGLTGSAAVVVAGTEAGLPRELCDVLRTAGLDATPSVDHVGAGLAAVAADASALAAATVAGEGAGAAGAAAGRVFEEVARLAVRRGGRAESFAGIAGAGQLVAGVLDGGAAAGAESRASVALLAGLLHDAHVRAPGVDGLAGVVAGETDAGEWARSVTRPGRATIKVAA